MTQEGYLTVSRREFEQLRAERDQLKADVRFYLKRIKELREKLAQVGSPPSPPASTSAVQQP